MLDIASWLVAITGACLISYFVFGFLAMAVPDAIGYHPGGSGQRKALGFIVGAVVIVGLAWLAVWRLRLVYTGALAVVVGLILVTRVAERWLRYTDLETRAFHLMGGAAVTGSGLAQVDPRYIHADAAQAHTFQLRLGDLQRDGIIACWFRHKREWGPFWDYRFLQMTERVGFSWRAYAIQRDGPRTAHIVWRDAKRITPGRTSLSGGTTVLVKRGWWWAVAPELGNAWRS